jgi:hypothetical protein
VVHQGEADCALNILEESIRVAMGEPHVTETPHEIAVHASQI